MSSFLLIWSLLPPCPHACLLIYNNCCFHISRLNYVQCLRTLMNVSWITQKASDTATLQIRVTHLYSSLKFTVELCGVRQTLIDWGEVFFLRVQESHQSHLRLWDKKDNSTELEAPAAINHTAHCPSMAYLGWNSWDTWSSRFFQSLRFHRHSDWKWNGENRYPVPLFFLRFNRSCTVALGLCRNSQ